MSALGPKSSLAAPNLPTPHGHGVGRRKTGAAFPTKKRSGVPRRACEMRGSAQPSPGSHLQAKAGAKEGEAEQQLCCHEIFLALWHDGCGDKGAASSVCLRGGSTPRSQHCSGMGTFLPSSQWQQEMGWVSLGEGRNIWRRRNLENLVYKTLLAGRL